MKEIKAFVKPNRIQKIIEALTDNGFQSMTLSQGEGTGAFKSKGARPSLDFHITDSPVIKIELVCQNEEAQTVNEIISANGKTDGIIYVSNIEDAFQIKTGDSLKRYNL